jgi:ABC-type nitrate/sulfonate/bicarbonate transport system substrate-binding protein
MKQRIPQTTWVPPTEMGRRRFLARSGGLMLGAAVLPAFLAACGDDDTPAAAGAAADGSLTPLAFQLGWLKGVQFGGHFAGIEQGYFAAEGVEPDFRSGGPNIDQISVVTSGQALIGDAGSDELVVARAAGLPVVAIAAGFQRSPFALMSLADAPIESLADMIGKTIAVSDGSRPQVEGLMEKEGLDPTEVDFVPKNPDPSVLPDGAVDGYFGFSTNEGTTLKEAGIDIVTTFASDLGALTYANVLFTTDEALAENRDLLLRFLRADVQGWQWAIDNPQELAEVVIEKYAAEGLELGPQAAEAAAQVELIDTGDAAENGLFWIDAPTFELNIADALAAGLIEEEIDAADVFTQELIAEVHSA